MTLRAPAPTKTLLKLRRVDVKTPEVKELHDAMQALVDDLNVRLVSLYYYALPIGTPLPLMAQHFPDDFTLGPKFLPMDGRTVKAPKSPLHGRTLTAPTTDLGVTGLTWWVRILD